MNAVRNMKMPPKAEMSVEERRSIQKEMEACNDGSWIKIASENNYDYNEVYFWVLVDDSVNARRAYNIIKEILKEKLEMYPKTEFILSFCKMEGEFRIDIEALFDKGLRAGIAPAIFGLRPMKFRKRKHTVFDRDF
jgi:hypothetical protein